MKKEYSSPEMEIILIGLNGILDDVIHSSFEQGGGNEFYTFNDGDDEELDLD